VIREYDEHAYREKQTDAMAYPSLPTSSSISLSSRSCASSTTRSSCFVRVAHSCDGYGGRGGCKYELVDTIELSTSDSHIYMEKAQTVVNLLYERRTEGRADARIE
jgi:hypothetical protein